MSQAQFETFMTAQVEAMQASGLSDEEWIDQKAEAFRNEWEQSQHA